ncbi:hypothetical protein Acr_00g0006490 [Actinidia rufa]|uniref:Reverse transcriptase zinc-binding domain-containing protein n=1 Tax=Actinidia rufa TaxID=165716 RepID=A0A7J0D822_9ERIC|nr:hypothetical protein Acr_00g0006490 [Actinidia rufa]
MTKSPQLRAVMERNYGNWRYLQSGDERMAIQCLIRYLIVGGGVKIAEREGRNLFVWEEELLSQIQQLLDRVMISNSKADELRWRWDKSGLFSIKSFYDKWESKALQDNPVGHSINLIWRNICPYRVEVFAWMAVQGKIATRLNLINRGILINGGNGVCPLCNVSMESVDHLLLLCNFSWSIWSQCVQWWGCSWVCPATIFDLMVEWFSNSFKHVEKACWEAIFFAIIWSLWKARNELIFSNVNIVKAEVVDLIKLRVAFWVKANCDLKEFSAVDAVEECITYLSVFRKLRLKVVNMVGWSVAELGGQDEVSIGVVSQS